MPRARALPRPSALAAAAHGSFTGAVVTLIPSADDAARLAVDGFEEADALHVTLAWLGDTDGDPAPSLTFDEAVEAVSGTLATDGTMPVTAEAFAVAVFNPASDERDPATVVLLQSPDLADLRSLMISTVGDESSFPVWFPHLTLGYTAAGDAPELDDAAIAERMGAVTFDRVRVSYGSEQTAEIVLGLTDEEPMTASTRRRFRIVNGPHTVTATAGCAPCSQGFADDVDLPAPVGFGTVADVRPGTRWTGVLAMEGTPTGDGRLFAEGALRWVDLPIPLRWVREDEGEHLGAVVVGRIEEIWRDGLEIRGRGTFDAGSADGIEAARQVAEQLTRGVSVDLDDVDMEIRIAADVLEDMEQPVPADAADQPAEDLEVDEDGRVVVVEFQADDEMMVFTDARVRAATIVATPAFAEAQLQIDEDEPEAPETEDEGPEPAPPIGDEDDEPEEMVAGSTPSGPPAAWFDDPQLPGPTPVTVTEDGRIFGHLAAWGTCHTAYPHECVTPPTSQSAYAYFRTGAVRAADGSTIATGRITLDTTHAGRRLGATDTVAHYEHTGRAAADVAAGEDAHGIWIAGALRPGLDPDQVRTLAASPLSGDWRRVAGQLELVHVLAVNSPGFPIPRALVAGGAVQALQSAGIVGPADHVEASTGPTDDDRILAAIIERERAAEQDRSQQAAEARSKVLLASAVAKARGR